MIKLVVDRRVSEESRQSAAWLAVISIVEEIAQVSVGRLALTLIGSIQDLLAEQGHLAPLTLFFDRVEVIVRAKVVELTNHGPINLCQCIEVVVFVRGWLNILVH